MAREITSARESSPMGLRSRNAVGGRADRAHGRPTWPSMNPRTAGKTGQWTQQAIRERFRNTNGK